MNGLHWITVLAGLLLIGRILSMPAESISELSAEKIMKKWIGGPRDPYRIVPNDQLFQHPTIRGLVEDIADSFGQTDECFRRDLLPIIHVVADYIQLLPASARHHHSYPLGLLHHSLDVCERMLRGARANVYDPYPAPPSSQREDFRYYGRICVALIGLSHDIGKVAKDMDIEFMDRKTLKLAGLPKYDPHGKGGMYSLTLYDYAVEHFGRKASGAPYRVTHRNGRQVNAHDSEMLEVVNAILTKTKLEIPSPVRAAYLDTQSDIYKTKIIPLKRRADGDSVRDALIARPVNQSEVAKDCQNIIEYLARNGLLRQLEVVDGCRFLSLGDLELGLLMLPDFADFACAPRNPDRAEELMHAIKASGFHREMKDDPSDPYAFDCHNGRYGLLLSPNMTAAILFWESLEHATNKGIADSDSATERGATDRDNDSGGSTNLPADELLQDSDCSNVVESPSSQEGAIQRRPNVRSRPELEPLVAFGRRLEQLTSAEIADEAKCRIDNGRLVIARSLCATILDDLGWIDPTDHAKFIELSQRHFTDRWRAVGDPLLEEIICTESYSKALLDKKSTSNLLLS